jgi:hypothetical protein
MRAISNDSSWRVGLVVLGLCCPGFAADPPAAGPHRSNYQLELEIATKEGPPQRYKVVTAGERVHASFLTPGTPGEEVEAPIILNFDAELEPLEPNTVWVRNFTTGQHVPVVTGTTRSGVPGPAREARGFDSGAGRDAAGDIPGERPRSVERRRPREAGDVAEPPVAEGPSPARNVGRTFPGSFGPMRQVQYMDIGTMSSVVLTLGKPVVVSESPTQRVTLTVRKLDN